MQASGSITAVTSSSRTYAATRSARLTQRYPRIGVPSRTLGQICTATPPEQDDFESLFAKELKRRGLEGQDDSAADSKKDPFQSAGGSTRTKTRAAPPSSAFMPSELDDQRKRTLGFVNEGLEGLIPRGSQLLGLGGSVFLGFLPFMLAFSLLFTGIYAVFGESFLHGGGANSGPPPYIDPQTLLSKPTVDPYIPY